MRRPIGPGVTGKGTGIVLTPVALDDLRRVGGLLETEIERTAREQGRGQRAPVHHVARPHGSPVRRPIGAGAVAKPGGWLPPRRPVHRPEPPRGSGALDLFGSGFCRELGVLPLSVRDGVVTVGLADLGDESARAAVARIADGAGLGARFIQLGATELQVALDRLVPPVSFEAPPSPTATPTAPEVDEPPTFHTEPPVPSPGPRAPKRLVVVPPIEAGLEGLVVEDPPAFDAPTEPSAIPTPPGDAVDDAATAGPPPSFVPAPSPAVEESIEVEVDEAPEDDVPASALGQQLVAGGQLAKADLAAALTEQERTGDYLGHILTHSGLVDELEIGAVLARQAGLALVDIESIEVDEDLVRLVPHELALRHLAMPYRRVEDGRVLVATADPDNIAGLELVEEYVGHPIAIVVATDTGIDNVLQRIHSADHIETAIAQLRSSRPEESAFKVISTGQKRFGIAVLALGLLSFVLSPILAFVVFNLAASFFYLGFSFYKLLLAYNSLGHDNEKHISKEQLDALDDSDLPVFTILMPMYREAEVVPKLVNGIAKLDYPRTKLDIKLLLEEDDDETLPAIEKLNLPPHFRVVIVPDALPKTKPKACNYGLLMARGDITVIYDAEDEPDPDQLKKVVVAFKQSDPATVCIQCKLNYYNRTQNLLTRWFTTEYSMWFDVFLPGLDAQDAPIPLGGTSNHFITDELRRLGAWDPHNVAEDADLGIRLNKAGWRTAVVDSTTYEEANPDLHNWIRQRSRWVKGYLQTYLVHMRHPFQLWRAIGTKRFLSFQLTVGGTAFGFLLNPVYWGLTTLWLLTEAGLIRQLFPGVVYYLAASGLFVGNFVFTYLNAAGSMRRGYFDLVKFALFSPVYWALMSWAAWKGAIQLITNPHYWEKTIHGLAERSEDHPE
ncbi:hypothetical protein DSM112329_00100 [Paraconexibacter sp. AEG42_29]|uniref:Type II secretion system protein GspE N-terminal domain-containing protein n=1 Tax=Paraconexibacter sp. AEG42_29 TaxID=2997339 RepID=A0AAU7ANR4_9ACTN